MKKGEEKAYAKIKSMQEIDGVCADALYGAAIDFKPVSGCAGGGVAKDIIFEELLPRN